ncbi:MAG: FHA domain-containing protein, partial [Myxococcales bacterium]|nr:FHA domain-containing protein [Myxococcales bacterium]
AKSTVTIGRERGDLILDDPLLSRVHCVIENYCEGGQFLLDARSERGTALNGVAIDTRHLLKVGDVIQIGNIRVVVGVKNAVHAPSALSSAAAQDRVAALRDRGDPDAPPRGDAGKVIPRNPYQRYPSEVSLPPSGNAGSRELDVRRRGSVDLRSGVATGIVDPSLARRLRSRDPEAAPRPAPEAPAPVPRAGRREPEALPHFEPRPGWGDPAKNAPAARGFDDVSTRISHVGNEVSRERGSGLWYLPQGSRGAPAESPRPIIRPRGDALPPEPPTAKWDAPSPAPARGHYDEPEPVPEPRRPIIRRPSPAGPPEFRGPTGSGGDPRVRNEAPDLTIGRQPEPVPSSRRADASRLGESRQPEAARPSAGDRDALGARAGERWYTPEHAGPRPERRAGEPMYYLPETRNRPAPKDDLDDAPKSPQGRFRRPSFGGRTQGFDPSDY